MMNTPDLSLLDQWQQKRDATAFQELVSRHSTMVFCTCRRILQNAADAEEVAQECFVALAQAEIKKVRILGGWLHSLATSRSLDRLRADKRRGLREQRYAETKTTHVDPTWDDIQNFVDEAIETLPEDLSSVVIGHFLEGRTQAEIADSLELSPSAVSRRVDRAVEEIRKHMKGRGITVGVALLSGLLGEASAEVIPQSLTASLGKLSLSGATKVATVATASSGLSLALKCAVGLVTLLTVATISFLLPEKTSLDPNLESIALSTPTPETTDEPKTSPQETIALASEEETADPTPDPVSATASVTGIVVFKDSGEPAEGMKVLLGTWVDKETFQETITDEDGVFTFENIAAGEGVMLAYDARYDEVPEDWFRSEHMEIAFAKGEAIKDFRIEVPSLGGQVSGRVYDEATGASLADVAVGVIQIGQPLTTDRSDKNGRYTIFGVSAGEHLVRIDDDNNSILSSDTTNSMQTVFVKTGETTQLDMAVDIGIPISGQVVDVEGNRVSKATIYANLNRPNGGGQLRCYFKSDSNGRFTVWGANLGDNVMLRAKKDELESHITVVNPMPGEAVKDLLITILPTVRVTGNFVDENNHAVNAKLWWAPIHPDGNGIEHGQGEQPAPTFEIVLAPGKYTVSGRPEGGSWNTVQPKIEIQVGTTPTSNLIIPVITRDGLEGNYSLSGTVVDEQGNALVDTSLRLDGSSKENFLVTKGGSTDKDGRFTFEGLMAAMHSIQVNTVAPYEEYPVLNGVNPAELSEINIVVRLSAKLHGSVVDAQTNEPIKNFNAEYGELMFPNREVMRKKKAISSDSGDFEINAELDKEWYIRISAEGYTPMMHSGGVLSSGEVIEGLEFKLAAGRVVHGRLSNESGEAIPDAHVYLNQKIFENFSYSNHTDAVTTSNAKGEFTLSSIPDEAEYVYLYKKGFAIAQYPLESTMDIVMTEGGIIEGHILMNNALPPMDIDVTAVSVDTPREYYRGKMDENGFYRIELLMDKQYRLGLYLKDASGNKIGDYSLAEYAEAVDGMTRTYDFSITTGTGSIEGIIMQDGTPLGYMPLQCEFAGYITWGNADESGYFHFENLPLGPVQIKVAIGNPDDPFKPTFKTIATAEIKDETPIKLELEYPTP